MEARERGPAALVHVTGTDVARGYEEDFLRWHREIHVPETLARPGWMAIRLYECTEGEPRYLCAYDLDETALAGPPPRPPFRDEPLGRRIRDHFGRTWRRIHAAGDDPARAALVNVISVEVAADRAEGLSRWYSDVHVPEIVACPGWLGAVRYESTGGGGRYLAIYGLEDAERPFATPEYEAAVGWDGWEEHLLGYHGFRIYRRIG